MRQILRSRCLDTKLICSYRNLEALSLRKTLSNGDEDADELELDKESSGGDEYQPRGEDGTATDGNDDDYDDDYEWRRMSETRPGHDVHVTDDNDD